MEIKQIHCGQYKRYGDFFRVWDIMTDKPKEEVINHMLDNVYKRRVPPAEEFEANIRYGGEKYGDMAYYFGGYYTIRKVGGGYMFTICEPYAD